MPRKPTRADRMIVANYIRAEATMMRAGAEKLAADCEPSAVLHKLVRQQETRAERLERVADWMSGDV